MRQQRQSDAAGQSLAGRREVSSRRRKNHKPLGETMCRQTTSNADRAGVSAALQLVKTDTRDLI